MAETMRKTFLTGFSLLLFFVLPVNAESQRKQISWDQATLWEIHRELAESKQRAVERQRVYQKWAAQAALESTQTNYDVLLYDIRLLAKDIPDTTVDSLYGVVKFVAKATVDSVTEIQIDLTDDNPIDSIISPAGSLSYTRADDIVTVTLPGAHNTGEQFEFDVYYRHKVKFDPPLNPYHRKLTTFSEPWGSREWWPCKDRPDDKADSFKIAVTVETAFYVGSNGTLDSIVNQGGGWRTFYYTEHYPMATYLFSLAIAEYTIWYDEWVYNDGQDTMLITNAVFPDYYDETRDSYDVVPGALTIFSERFGLYPFADEKYGHANTDGDIAMEHQTMSTMGTSERMLSEPVVVHELAHQWWGNMITCKSWGHVWLNEGFATYCEAIYIEAKQGSQAYHDFWGSGYTYDTLSVFVYDTTGVIFGWTQYLKGAYVLHMLRGLVGDSLFFTGMRAYYSSEFQYAAATTEDFRQVFEAAIGWELDWFFDEWVYGFGYPIYEWSYWDEPSDTGGTDVFFIIEQTQTTEPQVYTMPVDVRFRQGGSVDTTHTLWVDKRSELFKLNFDLDDIIFVQFDPGNWVSDSNQKLPWGIRIVTLQEEVSEGQQYLPYLDTIEIKGGYGLHTFSIINGALPSGYSMDDDGIISGVTSDTGLFTFTVYVEEQGPSDEVEFTMTVTPTPVTAGDVDYNGSVNVADITYLVDYLFQGGPPPAIADLADVDASCGINVADLTYLVDYLFAGGLAPVIGCVL